MTSEHTDIHADLSASVRAFAEREGGLERVRRLRDTEAGFDRATWPRLAQLGWVGLLAPEAAGGASLGLAEMAVVAREFGRALLPEPLTAVGVLALRVLQHSNTVLGERLLVDLIRGELVPTLAWQEKLGDFAAGEPGTETIPTHTGVRVSGSKRFVAFGLTADGYLVSARTASGIAVYWVPRGSAGSSYQAMRRADGTEHGTLSLDRVEVGADHAVIVARQGAQVLAQAVDEAVMISGAELLGVAERALEITLDYLRNRVQFGKPIGSFQALQHRCVDLFIQKELCVSALTAALSVWSSTDDRTRAALASRVKSRCADAALDICRKAIQLHGAIGFTDECDIGLYLKRALTLAAWLGNAQAHRRRYARLALANVGGQREAQAA